MDYLVSDRGFNDLSLADLLRARDQFHAHLLHKANVFVSVRRRQSHQLGSGRSICPIATDGKAGRSRTGTVTD